MPEQAEPLDVSSFDIPRPKTDLRCLGKKVVEFAVEHHCDQLRGVFPILDGQSQMKVSFVVDRAICLAAGGGETLATDRVDESLCSGDGIQIETVSGAEVREVHNGFFDGVVRIFQ